MSAQAPATTIMDLAKEITVDGVNELVAKRRGESIPKVTDGLRAKRAAAREGLHVFMPEELLTMVIEAITVNGRVLGYQRPLDVAHARRVARAMQAGKPFPALEVALDKRGRMAIVDGQHRAVAAVIARLPIEGIAKRRSREERAELFFGQRNAKPVDRNVLVLAGTGPFDRYVQEAVSQNDNAWSDLVSATRSSRTRISPYAMYQLLIRYVGNVAGQAASHRQSMDERWDRGLADELAPLIAAFGNKQTNPLAFRPFALQATGTTAMYVFRRHQPRDGDRERWVEHMPAFPFGDWPHLRTQQAMTQQLVNHWNKRLQGSRRVVV